jgi:hypothetical protein
VRSRCMAPTKPDSTDAVASAADWVSFSGLPDCWRRDFGEESGVPMTNPFRRPALPCLLLLALASPCTASLRLSEVLARNEGGLRDADQETPGWIELHNASAAPVPLTGWHLTDTLNFRAKWTFPATNLAAGGYLVVFASGKDRAVAGAELHTNFRLDSDGGLLALVAPDGVTVVSAFTNPPAVRRNISFGTGLTNATPATLLAAGAAARWLVPMSGALGDAWRAPGFADVSWNTTTTPASFEVAHSGSPAPPVLRLDFNDRDNNTANRTQTGFSNFVIGAVGGTAALQTGPVTRVFGGLSVTLSDSAPSAGYVDRYRTTPSDSGAFTLENLFRDFVFSEDRTGTSGLDLLITGLVPSQPYQFTVWSFDSGSGGNRVSDWLANGVWFTNYTFNGAVLPANDDANRIQAIATATAAGELLLAGRRDPVSGSGQPAVFINGLEVAPLIVVSTTNGNLAAMAGDNASVYLRQAFTVASPDSFNDLTLRIRYNDGFVAWLNGTEVARRNAPANPGWDASATASHAATAHEDIPLPGAAALLLTGTNVLAIQGLNLAATDGDLLIEPALIATRSGLEPNRFFSPPTPGAANDIGYSGIVNAPQFSVERGLFEAPITVALTSATAGAAVYWTTNGSAPTPSSGALYTAPLLVTNITFLRAAAFLPDFIPSEAITHSYLFLGDVVQQPNSLPGYPTTWQGSYPADYEVDQTLVTHPVYGLTLSNDLRALPILSIVGAHDDLWGPVRGIYNHATSAHDLDAGQDWERSASVELILPDTPQGTTAFALNCGVRMQGNASRDNARTPKHSFRLLFKGDYGPTKLSYPLFPGPVQEFDNLILRAAGFVDGWPTRYNDLSLYTNAQTGEVFRGNRYRPETSTYLRDLFVKDSHRAMGWFASRSDWVHLYINGLYWGLYNPSERLDASYLASHAGGWESDWDVLVGDDILGIAMPADGTKDDWTAMMNLVNAGVTSETAYQAVADLVDLDSLIDYMLLHFFIETEDWPHHNFYCAHRRANPTNGLPATRWQFLTWDQELSLDRFVSRDRINVSNNDTPARIYSRLRAWPEFRVRFGDRVQKHLFNGGALTPENNVARFAARALTLTNALVGESARWGDAREFTIGGNPGTGITFTPQEWWVPELHRLWTNLFPTLNDTCLNRLRANELYPTIASPTFSQFGGTVPAGFALALAHPNASGTIYFTTDGSDPRAYGTGAVAPGALPYAEPLVLNATTVVRARVLSGGIWSALVEAPFYPPQDLTGLAVTEVMYNPPGAGMIPGDEFEFLELQNTGTNVLDLGGLHFSAGLTFSFPDGTQLAPGAFAVLARNAGAFASRYPGVQLTGLFTGRLDNAGETLTLAYPTGGRLFSLSYDDDAPWPATADGFGFSLVPRQPGLTAAPDDGTRWRASTSPGGSPGAADSPAPASPAVVVNEVLPHTDPPEVDAIELFNPGPEGATLGGWFLTDNRNQPRKFRIPDGTALAAGDYAVFTAEQFGVGTSTFGLSELGEQVYLFAADAAGNLTGYSHGFDFGAADNRTAFGRHLASTGEEQFPAQAVSTLGGTNSGPRIGPVVINEIHYHPADGVVEFIELASISDQPVTLFDPDFPTNRWRLDGISFNFPPQITLDPGELLLLVAEDPASFRAQYDVPAAVQVFGPYGGALQNEGEWLRLQHPGTPQPDGFVPLISTDEVRYRDQAPWPGAADGTGPSLQRITSAAYGNDPANWHAATPTPGRANAEPDTDGDGVPDSWELAHGTDLNSPDADDDPDGDGLTNGQEYLAGTDPRDPQSMLRVTPFLVSGTELELRFPAAPQRYHRVLAAELPSTGDWTLLTNYPPAAEPLLRTLRVPVSSAMPRFFRVEAGLP